MATSYMLMGDGEGVVTLAAIDELNESFMGHESMLRFK